MCLVRHLYSVSFKLTGVQTNVCSHSMTCNTKEKALAEKLAHDRGTLNFMGSRYVGFSAFQLMNQSFDTIDVIIYEQFNSVGTITTALNLSKLQNDSLYIL